MESLLELKLYDFHAFVAMMPLGIYVAIVVATLGWLILGYAFWRRTMVVGAATLTVVLLVTYFSGPGRIPEMLSPGLTTFYQGMLGTHLLIAFLLLIVLLGLSFWLERRTTIERVVHEPIVPRILLTLVVAVGAFLYVLSMVALTTSFGT